MGLALDEPNENETAQVNGIDVLISKEVESYTDSKTIDYVNSPYGQGFVITSTGPTIC